MWSRLQPQNVESTTRKLKDKAAQALGKRKYEQAVECYLALTHIEPEEPLHAMKLGELYLRLQSPALALELFRSAFKLFDKQCAFRKAAAVAQTILEIDPGDLDVIDFLNRWRKSELFPKPLMPVSIKPQLVLQTPPAVRPPERTDFYLGEDPEEMMAAGPVTPPFTIEGPSAADGWGCEEQVTSWDVDFETTPIGPPVPSSYAFDGVGSPRTSRRRAR